MKRYLHEKIAFVQRHRPDDEHVLVVPAAETNRTTSGRARTYSIRSPLVSRATGYRALLNLDALDQIIERERPDIIESGDPYQLGWKALGLGEVHRVPVVAFYHSHFAEAYLRRPAERVGAARVIMPLARRYTRALYHRFAKTLVPSAGLCAVLQGWGVQNTERVGLGVDVEVFRPLPDREATRASLRIPPDHTLLLYVGRLAAEKNTGILFDAFASLARRHEHIHLLVIGDGQERARLRALEQQTNRVHSISYCAEPETLAPYYRAADLFVHPGVEETFGLAALESQACGRPVVGIRGTFMDEVILHEQADWADENSADSLADAIERMATRADLNALGLSASKLVVERYAWRRVFERLFSIYGAVIESDRPRR